MSIAHNVRRIAAGVFLIGGVAVAADPPEPLKLPKVEVPTEVVPASAKVTAAEKPKPVNASSL